MRLILTSKIKSLNLKLGNKIESQEIFILFDPKIVLQGICHKYHKYN